MFESQNEQVEGQGLDTQSSETQGQQEQGQESDALSFEKGVSLSEKVAKKPDLLENESLLDLDKAGKFRWNGKVITSKDLKSMTMFQSDYTKKTQELAQQRKYYDNLTADLSQVKANPALAEEFKRIYPESFHSFLKMVLPEDGQKGLEKPQDATQQAKPEESSAQKQDPRLEEMYKDWQQSKSEAAAAKVNALFDRLNQQYPKADEEKILARVQSLLQLHKQNPAQYKKPDDALIESMFKNEHDRFEKTLKEHLSAMLEEQKKAGRRAAGPGSGGGIPGGAPKLPRTIKEASDLVLSDPSL